MIPANLQRRRPSASGRLRSAIWEMDIGNSSGRSCARVYLFLRAPQYQHVKKIISDGDTRLFTHLAPSRATSEHLRDRQDALIAQGQLPKEANPVAFRGTRSNDPSGWHKFESKVGRCFSSWISCQTDHRMGHTLYRVSTVPLHQQSTWFGT